MGWGWPERARRACRWIELASSADEQRLIRHQVRGAALLRCPPLAAEQPTWVLGVDAQIDDGIGIGAAVMFRVGVDAPQQIAIARRAVHSSYRFGFLGFRELGPILAAVAQIDQRPDLVFC